MKRVVLVHGWDGSPDKGWFPWLASELKNKGFEVIAPQLPQPELPRIHNWIPALSETIGKVTPDTYFVGHSMGVQAIARFVEQLPDGQKAGGAVFVAGFFKRLTGLEDDFDVLETDKHWLTTPLDLDRVKAGLGRSVAIFSDNDPYVPMDNVDDFKTKLSSEIVILKNMQHLGDSFNQVPVILEKILQISSD